MAKSKTLTQKLLTQVAKKGGLTRKEITAFLIGVSPKNVDYVYREQVSRFGDAPETYWNAQLFGTKAREGLVGRFLKVNAKGVYTVKKNPPKGPFYPTKNVPFTLENTDSF